MAKFEFELVHWSPNVATTKITMKPILHTIAAAALALVLLGCATAGRKIDQAAVDKIQKGQTTKAEVKGLIGSPDTVTKTGDGTETWSYMFVRASAKGQNFIPIVGAFAGGVNTQHQSTTVTFGADGIVSQVVSSFGGMESDSGLSAGGKARLPETEKDKRPK